MTNAKDPRLHSDPKSYWSDILSECASSGLTIAEFCRRYHHDSKSFRKWEKILSFELPRQACAAPLPMELVPVSLPADDAPGTEGGGDAAPETESGVSVAVRGLSIRLAKGFDEETFRRVLALAGGGAC